MPPKKKKKKILEEKYLKTGKLCPTPENRCSNATCYELGKTVFPFGRCMPAPSTKGLFSAKWGWMRRRWRVLVAFSRRREFSTANVKNTNFFFPPHISPSPPPSQIFLLKPSGSIFSPKNRLDYWFEFFFIRSIELSTIKRYICQIISVKNSICRHCKAPRLTFAVLGQLLFFIFDLNSHYLANYGTDKYFVNF